MVESVGAFRPAGTIPPGTSDDIKVGGPKANVPKGVGGDGGDAPPVSSGPSGPGIGAPNPAPPKPGTSDPSSVASTLSQFASNAPSIQQIAQIIQDANLRAREAARIDRQASRDAEQQALHSAADKIRDEANFNLGAAIATSALAIAGAAMTIGGALKAQSIRSEAISEAEPLKTELASLWASAEAASSETVEEPPPGATGTAGSQSRAVTELETELEEKASPPPPPRETDDMFMDRLDAMIQDDPAQGADAAEPLDLSNVDLPDIDDAPRTGTANTPPPRAGAKLSEDEPEWDDEPPAPPESGASQPAESSEPAAALRAAASKRLDQLAADIKSDAEGRATTVDKVWTGRGVVVTEMGKIAGAGLQRAGAEKAAEKAEQEAKASAARTKAEDQTDFIHAYTDNIRAIQEKLSAIQQAEADTMRTILRA